MLKDSRQDIIITILEERGVVDITSLSRALDVTPITIRRDLSELEHSGLIERLHGGARLKRTDKMVELPYDLRTIRNKPEKEAIARAAASLIGENMNVVIDSGTTTNMMSEFLDREMPVTIITNSIRLANELMLKPSVRVINVGGEIRKETYACSDDLAQSFISSLRADIAFLGVTAVDLSGTAFNISIVELGIKSAMMAVAKKTYILADSSKIGKTALVRFADIADAGVTLITDDGISRDLLLKLQDHNVDIIVAERLK